MVRPTIWKRNLWEYADLATQANYHALHMDDYTAGQTIVRMRFRYQANHSATTAADATGFGIALGIALLPVGEDPSTSLHPFLNPNQEYWMWWEASFFRPYSVTSNTGTQAELDVCPDDPGERDFRAARIVDADSSLWMVAESTGLSPAQSTFYLSGSYSVLVKLP